LVEFGLWRFTPLSTILQLYHYIYSIDEIFPPTNINFKIRPSKKNVLVLRQWISKKGQGRYGFYLFFLFPIQHGKGFYILFLLSAG
jgi:hypothetical protein